MSMILTSMFQTAIAQETYEKLARQGKKYWINDDHYFTYHLNKKPQLGTLIVKIELFNKDKKQDHSMKIIGDSGMPAMKGHHDTGDVPFQLNKKGDYLLPVNVVMPGVWEIKIRFIKDDKPIYRGSIRFDV
jgi:hypothetical protein